MDPLELGKLVILLGGLAALYLKINKGIRELTGKGEIREISPNPLNVQHQHRPATMEDVESVEKRVGRLEKHVLKVEKNQDDIETKIDGLRDTVTDRFDDFRDRMDDKMETIHRSIGRLEGGN